MEEITEGTRAKFVQRFTQQHYLRLAMTGILSATMAGGIVTNWLMFHLGVQNIGVRYPVAALAGYLLFLFVIRLWLWSTVQSRTQSNSTSFSQHSLDLLDGNTPVVFPSMSNSSSGYRGGGGKFSGGGSSGSWGESSASGSGRGGGSTGSSIDGDNALAIIAVVALVAVFAGSAVYLIYSAPTILGESAFQAAFAGILAKRARSIHAGGWLDSILKSTWKPFSCTVSICIIFGLFCHHLRPDAHRIVDLFQKPAQNLYPQNEP